MVSGGGALSRNPNMCASCSSLVDGEQDIAGSVVTPASEFQRPVPAEIEEEYGRAVQHDAFEVAGYGISRKAA